MVCLTTPLRKRRAPNATSRATGREQSFSWAAPFVIAENTPRKNQVSCSLRNHLMLHHLCIFCRSQIQGQPSPAVPQVARAPERSSRRSRANSGHGSRQVDDVHMRERPRSNSTPQKRQPMTVDEDMLLVPSHASRTRAKSMFAISGNMDTLVSIGECYRRWSA